MYKYFWGYCTPDPNNSEMCAFNIGLNPERWVSDAISNSNPMSANVNNL